MQRNVKHKMYPVKHKVLPGYTLAEILIVSTILVIISASVLIGLNPLMQIFRGYDTRRKDNLDDLRKAFEAYYADHDCYPPAEVLENCGGSQLSPYLTSIPCDPQDNTPYTISIEPPDSVCPQQYAIYSKLANPKDDSANYPDCPQTLAVSSPNMPYVDVVAGCNGIELCPVYYGCSKGICTVVARDKNPTCAPNYCDSDCGGVNCARKVRGRFVNDCVAR